MSSKLVVLLWKHTNFFNFKHGCRRHLGFLKSRKFYWLLWSREWRRISVLNFVKIGQSVAKILRFFDFSRWRPSPSWIFEIINFYLLTVSVGPRRITVPNWNCIILFVIVVKTVETHQHAKFCRNRSIGCKDIKIFWFFQDGGRRHLGFSK